MQSVFDLAGRQAAKAAPELVERDEEHFAAIARALDEAVADLTERLDTTRRQAGGTGQEAMDRDLEVHRLTTRLRTLRRYGLDLCLRNMVSQDNPAPTYVGRLGLTDRSGRRLLIDWRSPAAEPVIRAALPDANVPASVRSTGVPVLRGSVSDLGVVVETWLAGHDEGTACVISTQRVSAVPDSPRVRALTPELAKGLEFDLVVLVEPDTFGEGIEGAVDRYVAMTRATQQLVVLG